MMIAPITVELDEIGERLGNKMMPILQSDRGALRKKSLVVASYIMGSEKVSYAKMAP